MITNKVVDRDGQVVEPLGSNFEGFLDNPVVLWLHPHDEPPVGQVLDLTARVHFFLREAQQRLDAIRLRRPPNLFRQMWSKRSMTASLTRVGAGD